MNAVLSLDIGGTKLAASVLTRDGTLLAKRRTPTGAGEGPAAVLDRILDTARAALRAAGVPPSSVGISVAGPLDRGRGVVDHPPNLPGWDRVPLRSHVARGLGVPEAHVTLDNDANACALAEQRFGAARGVTHAIYLTMSTGIGGALILDGRLYRGFASQAGEVGHQIVVPDGPRCGCGGSGCLEAVASGSAIATRLREEFATLPAVLREAAGSPGRITAEHLIAVAKDGNPDAVERLRVTARLLARGVANLVYILNPQRIILGTLAYHAGDLLIGPLRDEVDRLCWPVLTSGLEIVATPLGPRLEELSGLAVVLEAENPDNRPSGCPTRPTSP